MAKTKEQKKEILNKLQSVFKNAQSATFVHFNGLGVSDEGNMRNKLRENSVSYFVAKKTLIRKALEESGVKGSQPELQGEVAVVYDAQESDDPTLTARSVQAFVKSFGNEKLTIVGGIYERCFKDKEGMQEIAIIPPVPVLRGMFVNVINSPIQSFVIALNEIAKQKK